MRYVKDTEAIERLRDHCRKCKFTIISEDFTTKGLVDNTLVFKNDKPKSKDSFIISGKFAGQPYTETEGRLLEVLHHFNLLSDEELFDSMSTTDGVSFRSNRIRAPWDRAEYV